MRFLQIDFMRRRNLWFAISGTVIVNMAVKIGITLVYARRKGLSAAIAMTASVVALAVMIAVAWTRL